ncbi:MAG: radical SAM protein [Sandaracinaceae bacterium]|nr:radical SAM protein [Sandaracinaceae bacterium]
MSAERTADETADKTRPCPACGADVTHTMSGREALEVQACPRCGGEVLFTSYERMDIALSEYCNLTCQMCRRPSEALFMDPAVAKRAIDEAALVGVGVVSFSGGEPFVHPQFLEILEHAFGAGIRVQLVSNGTLIKEKHLPLLERLDCLTISIDGTEAAHDHIRQKPGTYRRSLKTIAMLTERSSVQWGTNTVMQRDNYDCLYDSFKAIQAIGGRRYAYCGFSHVEVVPETAHFQMTPEQEEAAHAQIVRIERECSETNTWFNERTLLLDHFEMYARKGKRYRPIDGCKIPQKFIGLSDHGFYLCWHQGRNIERASLVDALRSELARDIVREGLEKRCVACNGFNYAWDEEWNAGMIASALAGDAVERGVERGVVALRVPERVRPGGKKPRAVGGAGPGNTVRVDDGPT